MGSLHAQEFANSGLPLETSLTWHLTSNHFPPVHEVFVPVAIEAIELANEGNWQDTITMPNGVTLTVASIVEQLHLDAFLDNEEDDEWDWED